MSVVVDICGIGDDTSESLRIDRKETGSDYVFTFDVPGLPEEGVTAEISDGKFVQIRWKSEDGVKHFKAMIHVPENANLNGVAVVMNDGVITITLPKSETNQPGAEDRAVEITR